MSGKRGFAWAAIAALLLTLVLTPAVSAHPGTAVVSTQQLTHTERVTFNISYQGCQIATTVTQETFFGPVSFGTWTTTDMNGTTVSTGNLAANHTTSSVSAFITQSNPIFGFASMQFDISGGAGTLTYTAFTNGGTQHGTVNFTASSSQTNVFDVDVDSVPPVLFNGPTTCTS